MAATGTETFGKRVKRIRERKGIRQTDLAATAGISWRHLIRIEQDAGGATREATIARLAAALGVKPAELTGDTDDEEEHQLPDLNVVLLGYLRKLIREEAHA